MEWIVLNISAAHARYERYDGRDYLVAPLTMIVPGVLPGSQGPLLYPPGELNKNILAWNYIPIVVYHPVRNGVPVTARDPLVLEKQGIGHVFHSRFDGKLKAEGWFDILRTRRVDNRVLAALENGEPIELSTGLYTHNVPAPEGSTYNGRAYTHIAYDYRPDHLAILPDQKGACSLDDGCGVLVNRDRSGSLPNIDRYDHSHWALATSYPGGSDTAYELEVCANWLPR